MLKSLTLPLVITLLIHSLIVAALLIDWSGERTVIKRQTPKYVEAKLVTLEKPKAQPKPKVKKAPPPKPQPIKPIIEAQPKEQPKVLNKDVLDPNKLAQEQQRLAEQRRLQAEKDKLLQTVAADIADAISDEQETQQELTEAELANSLIALITQAIERNWSRPASARNGMEAELVLDLVPTGEVINVSVVKSSGNVAFDRSAVAAVKRARQFPELQQLPPKVFQEQFRRLRMKFKPEDLRR
ncbi:TonB family protein [Dasania sp. GY-MA-18]|uniref:TonB family protein n=1 Tax=Dasania phycosphaerae TaxID=2950436 RepID=A0A9J6RH07_9GAMM|nr:MULTISPECIES: energy transducer TonB [Dasania]MCR8921140.1 TonB family protein [Dasania sp. GY-MA-18]MCZ0863568.1 TonB family protein [Dasania phycosphaerae]MCZ0867296.1 TonB family protein [Dasania phycosphaerae]